MGFLGVKFAFFLFGSFFLVAGRSHHERVKRIIGGSSVDIERVPYMLSLRLDGKHICGAVIIGDKWCLTAAHCCISGNLTVQTGTSNLNEGGDCHRVTELTRHELYHDNDDDYDLCALRVDKAFEYSNVTAPVKLPNPKGTHLIDGSVAGWGYTEADGTALSPQLQLMNVSRVDLKDCKYAYRKLYTIHDDDVCYGSDNGSKDACQGDSGGPLVNQDSVLIGIVSYGDECGYSKLPGVYVDVMQFLEWIERTTKLHPE